MHPQNAKQVWQAALGELELQMTKANYNTWLKDTAVISYEDDLFVVGVPTTFVAEWLEARMKGHIKRTLISILGRTVDVRFVVRAASQNGNGTGNGYGGKTTDSKAKRRSGKGLATLAHAPLPEDDLAGTSFSSPAASTAGKLHSRYTFDSFVVGSSNRLAHAAALAAAERPGETYNPLFIYGGVGLGKTHLLHAIGHLALGRRVDVIYVSSEQFTNELINAIRERKNEEFRAKYRSTDILLIDDIHFICGKESTQEEFFHTFNDLHSASRQIVISSDRPPKSLSLLEDRLRSRFEWGLIADIQPPDFEMRVAILRAKAEIQRAIIPPEVLDFIAQKVQSNIRELEGALNRLLAYTRLNHLPLNAETATFALNEVFGTSSRRRTITPELIVQAVAKYYSLEAGMLRGKKRDRETALARQIAMHIMREETQLSLGEIGQQLGGRDHTTVIHGCEKISTGVQDNNQLKREILEIKEMIHSGKGLEGLGG